MEDGGMGSLLVEVVIALQFSHPLLLTLHF